jgi:hypothetical protein
LKCGLVLFSGAESRTEADDPGTGVSVAERPVRAHSSTRGTAASIPSSSPDLLGWSYVVKNPRADPTFFISIRRSTHVKKKIYGNSKISIWRSEESTAPMEQSTIL